MIGITKKEVKKMPKKLKVKKKGLILIMIIITITFSYLYNLRIEQLESSHSEYRQSLTINFN